MPVVFEEIDTEISREPRAEPQASDTKPATPPVAQAIENIRRELARIEARRLRLKAD